MRLARRRCARNARGVDARRARRGCSAGCRRPGGRRTTKRTPGNAATSAARASSRNAGIAETGSEMSCLMFGPSRRCASAMFSRSAHSACACSPDCATVGVARDAALDRRRRARASSSAASGESAALSSACTSAYQGWPGSGSGSAGMMLARQRERRREISSKPTSRSPSACLQSRAAARSRRATSATRGERGGARARRREELQHRGGDDAERAFGADEELLQVVAGVVLAQAAQAVPDAAVGKHDLDAQRQLARVAEAQHRGAAGVGRQVAADRAAALGGERQRKHAGPRAAAASCTRGERARRLRRSSSRCRHRPRARGSSARATPRPRRRSRPASRRRTARCCRPAERSATPASAQARTTAATSLGGAGTHDGLRARRGSGRASR